MISRLGLAGPAAALAGAVLAAGLAAPAASADPGATGGLRPAGDPDRPMQVARTDARPTYDEPEPIRATFTTSTDAHDITVSTSGEGLTTVVPRPGPFDLDAGQTASVEVDVTADSPGFHALSVTLTSPDGGTATQTLPYVWNEGDGFDVPADGDLTGRTYGYQGYSSDYSTCEGCSDLEQHRVTFVTPRLATVGGLSGGRSTCASADDCVPYHYDADTGLVQVGESGYGTFVGQVLPDGLFTSGLVDSDPTDTSQFYGEFTLETLTRPADGTRLGGHFLFGNSQSNPSGIGGFFGSVRLQLLTGGHYSLRYTVGGRDGGTVHHSGHYRIESGRLLMSHRVRTRHGHHRSVTSTATIELIGPAAHKPLTGIVVRLPLVLRGRAHQRLGGVRLTHDSSARP